MSRPGPRIKVTDVKYHGNGPADGFYTVRFDFRDGRDTRHLLATLFMRDDEPTEQFAVVDIHDEFRRFDGYFFLPSLEQAVREASYPMAHSRSYAHRREMERDEPRRQRVEARNLAEIEAQEAARAAGTIEPPLVQDNVVHLDDAKTRPVTRRGRKRACG